VYHGHDNDVCFELDQHTYVDFKLLAQTVCG